MRTFLTLSCCVAVLVVAGCDSVSSFPSRVQERFEAPQPQLRLYSAEQKPVFEAAQRAMKRIDFVVSRAGAATGIIKAHSPLRSTTSFGKARQYAFEVHVQTMGPGETQVSAVLREQEESESFAGATDIPLRQHGLYDSFFAALGQELGESGREPGMPATAK
ncbi:hypothetical protein [Opitutus terrae]|uniref:Lipoprotein n=1 Tax=Opitutus terrae (strain DSM 11246 / JCM 15787 / PB90-1) TaxID=452637 RepID=B1ZX88_OPITP|nr:hypothetical protein [Opitutus terrae]ACB76140.1 hypothetical protein Oter_2859 [Opitutus terrae PB90-1]